MPARIIGGLGGGQSTSADETRRESYRGDGVISAPHPFTPRVGGTLCVCWAPVDDWRHLRHVRKPARPANVCA